MKILLLCLFVLIAVNSRAQCTTSGTALATSYVSNNSNKGEMFNLVATNTITVLCFDLNLILGSSGSYEIYYKTGTYVGSESNAAVWTLIGSNASVACVGFDIPSPMSIPVNIVIPAGQTYGFYVTATNTAATTGIRYTNNPGYTTIASDANVAIAGGIGKAYPFSTNYGNRSFNGTLHYVSGIALPVELSGFWVKPLGDRVHISWQTQTEQHNNHFTVERSADGETWEQIGTVKGTGDTQEETNYAILDQQPLWGVSYYRLTQTDENGHTTYYDMRSLNREPAVSESSALAAFPNPATNVITLGGSEDELGAITLVSVLGEDLTQQAEIMYHYSSATIDISRLNNGIILVRSGNRSSLIVKE